MGQSRSMAKYWFKPKRYGYGATPVTWQGWMVSETVLVVVRSRDFRLYRSSSGVAELLAFDLVDIASLDISAIARPMANGAGAGSIADRFRRVRTEVALLEIKNFHAEIEDKKSSTASI